MIGAVHGTVTRKVARKLKSKTKVSPARSAKPAHLILSPPAPPVAWSTPALFRLGIYAVFLATLLLLSAALADTFFARDALTKIGRQAGPGVLTTDRMQGSLLDLDASAVTEILMVGSSNPLAFGIRRQEVADSIIGAAENMSYRDLERVPLRDLEIMFGFYCSDMEWAPDRWRAGDLGGYRRAAARMDRILIPTAQTLNGSLSQIVEATYAQQNKLARALFVFLTTSALLTFTTLVALQWLIASRTRRLINPLLFAATIATVAFSSYSVQVFQREDRDFRTMKQQVFDTEHQHLQAIDRQKTLVRDASRHKLDPLHFPPATVSESLNQPVSADTGPTLETSVATAFQDLSGLEFVAPAGALVIALLTFFGVLPRLREYSA